MATAIRKRRNVPREDDARWQASRDDRDAPRPASPSCRRRTWGSQISSPTDQRAAMSWLKSPEVTREPSIGS